MTDIETHDWDGCLMCAVRALTEGRPKDWAVRKTEEWVTGEKVTGVVLRMGEQPSHFEARVPYVDLWLGGIERVRVGGHGTSLREALLAAEVQVGDTITVIFTGNKVIQTGSMKGKTFRTFEVAVQRGHH